jgi:hypothetical protein
MRVMEGEKKVESQWVVLRVAEAAWDLDRLVGGHG